MSEIHRKRVQEGMAWILANGERYGLDVSRFDPDELDVSSTFNCVLGQLRGMVDGMPGYHVVRNELFPTTFGRYEGRAIRMGTWMILHGFMLDDAVTWGVEKRDQAYRQLHDEWKAAFAALAQ